MIVVLQFVGVLLLAPLCSGYSMGPPYNRCEYMIPYHRNVSRVRYDPQTSPSPYSISVSNTSYSLGGSLTINITGTKSFKGFLLQARSNDSAIPLPVGSFSALPPDSRYMYCSGSESSQNTVSHKNSAKNEWTLKQFTWQAPKVVAAGDVHFWATVVHNYTTFWTYIKSGLITGPSAASPNATSHGTNFVITKAGCNETKSCYSIPPTCSNSNDCHYLLTYSVTGDNVMFEMSAMGQFVAVGFNDKPFMDKADEIVCARMANGVLEARVFVNTRHSPERRALVNSSDFSLLQAFYENGVIKCRTNRKIITQSSFLRTLNKSSRWYLIFAYGPASSTGSIQYHTKRAFTPGRIDISTPSILTGLFTQPTSPPSTDNKIDKTGCGKTKGCYSVPRTCTDSSNCEYLLTYKKIGDEIEFELSADNDWVAIGFNVARGSMAGTDAMICANINNVVQVNHYDLKGRSLPSKPTSLTSAGDITVVFGVGDGGRTRCKFRRKIKSSTSGMKDLSATWHLVFAKGGVQGSDIRQHPTIPSTSPGKVDLQVAAEITGGTTIPTLIKAHGSLMTIAWIGCATIALFMARYMRLVWPDDKLLGQKVWFTIHRGLMVCVVILSITGAILAFVQRKGWSNTAGAHPYTGIITVSLAIIQPIMAFFRPHPGESNRYIFNWAHRTVGLSAWILGVVTLFLAVFLQGLSLEKTGFYVLIAYCVGVLLVLVFEIFLCTRSSSSQGFSTSQSKGTVEQMQVKDPQSTSTSSSDECCRKLMLGFVVLFALATALTLVILVAMG